MTQPGSTRRTAPTWLLALVGVLVLAVIAVWGTIAITGSTGAEPTAGESTADESSDEQTDAVTTDGTTSSDEPDDGLLTLTEAAGEAGFTATTSIWSGQAPAGFTLVETDQPGLWLESTAGCTIVLVSEQTATSRDNDALATQDRIQDLQERLGQVNEDLAVIEAATVLSVPVMEDGSGGRIELERFTVAYLAHDGHDTQTSVLLRTFHDLGVTLMLTYTCPTADLAVTFDDVLGAPLWVEPS